MNNNENNPNINLENTNVNVSNVNSNNSNLNTSNTTSVNTNASNTISAATNNAVSVTNAEGVVNNQTVNVTDKTVVQTGNINSSSQPLNNNLGGGEGAVVNENLKTVEVNYKPPSKFKTFMMIMLFVFFIAFVIFLPDINSYVNQVLAGKNEKKEEIITTGKLECNLKTNTTNLDIEYKRIFGFTDNKIDNAKYTIITKGDITLDETTLNTLNDKCLLIKGNTSNLEGVSIECNYQEGKLVEEQNFNLRKFDKEKIDAAFSEAGGTYPAEFEAGDDIAVIEKTMLQAGYSCGRKK